MFMHGRMSLNGRSDGANANIVFTWFLYIYIYIHIYIYIYIYIYSAPLYFASNRIRCGFCDSLNDSGVGKRGVFSGGKLVARSLLDTSFWKLNHFLLPFSERRGSLKITSFVKLKGSFQIKLHRSTTNTVASSNSARCVSILFQFDEKKRKRARRSVLTVRSSLFYD